MKLAVFAYHDIGYECLKLLADLKEEIVAVVTHEDDPKEEIWFRSVARLAQGYSIPVYTPLNPNKRDFIETLQKLGPELILSFYYRRLLSPQLLDIPRLGGINLHGSLLPRYRGRSPVNWVLINGERETGVTLHYMVQEADAGDIITQRSVPIDIEDTAATLFYKLTEAAVGLLKETYPRIKAGMAPRTPQDSSLATIFGGRRPEHGEIHWYQSAEAIYNLVRAVTHPYPGAFTFHGGKKLFVWSASLNGQSFRKDASAAAGTIAGIEKGKGIVVSTEQGSFLATRLQLEGEEELPADVYAERHHVRIGSMLGR